MCLYYIVFLRPAVEQSAAIFVSRGGNGLCLDLQKHTCLLDEKGTLTGAVGGQVQSGLVRDSLVR